jgi:8-oxo-dGTP diphosphatase
MVTVDALVVSKANGGSVLLIERGNEPFKGCMAMPGGFLELDEELEAAALRELTEETGVVLSSLAQIETIGTVNRDPRGRVITVVYYAVIDDEIVPKAGDDAARASWIPLSELGQVKFAGDHARIVPRLINRIQGEI